MRLFGTLNNKNTVPIKEQQTVFPIMEIEQGDLGFIKKKCAGLIHGGVLSNLNGILDAEAIIASPFRPKKSSMAKDQSKEQPAGWGIYCRFVSAGRGKNDYKIVNSLCGVGSGGGCAFYIDVKDTVGMNILTVSSFDGPKFGYEDLNKGCERLYMTLKYIFGKPMTQAEIAIYERIEVEKVSKIFISRNEWRNLSDKEKSEINKNLSKKGFHNKRIVENSEKKYFVVSREREDRRNLSQPSRISRSSNANLAFSFNPNTDNEHIILPNIPKENKPAPSEEKNVKNQRKKISKKKTVSKNRKTKNIASSLLPKKK